MGSPDPRQIDGMGGADPLTSKVAVVQQVRARGDRRRLPVPAGVRRPGDRHRRAELRQHPRRRRPVRDRARAGRARPATRPAWRSSWRTPARSPSPRSRRPAACRPTRATRRSTACPAPTRRSRSNSAIPPAPRCGALLPTGNAADVIEGVRCTLIDNGMPCIVFKAEDVGATGYETRDELESDAFADLRARIETIRLAAGPLMNLGDVDGQVGPQDDARRPAAARRRGDRAQLHPAPRPRHDRRARRGQRGDRVPGRRLARGRGGARFPKAAARRCRSSTRPAR